MCGGFPGGSDSKSSACNAGDLGSVPGSGRSPGEGNGNPLQYSCLENPMDGGAWQATVDGVTKSRTRLSDSLSHAWPAESSSPWTQGTFLALSPAGPSPTPWFQLNRMTGHPHPRLALDLC